MPVLAQLQPLSESPNERRRTPRLLLRLGAKVNTGATALVHDLSTRGLLFETAAPIGSDRIQVHLPEVPAAGARIVWSHGRFYGCEFEKPLPHSAVSIAVLRREPRSPDTALGAPYAANDRDQRPAPEQRSLGGPIAAAIGLALAVAGAVALIMTGHLFALMVIGLAAILILGLLAAIMYYALDNSPHLKI